MTYPTPLPNLSSRGAFIVFEGIDGTGKSTQVRLLTEWLQNLQHAALQSYEPTRGPFGLKLRKSMQETRLPHEEELRLFMQDREWHLEHTVLPALRAGTHVVLDRYYFSTAAYQGNDRTPPDELLRRHASFAPAPDLLFLLDMDPRESLQRAKERSGSTDTFETPALLQRARSTFLDLTRDLPYAHTLNAATSLEALHATITKHISHFLKEIHKPTYRPLNQT